METLHAVHCGSPAGHAVFEQNTLLLRGGAAINSNTSIFEIALYVNIMDGAETASDSYIRTHQNTAHIEATKRSASYWAVRALFPLSHPRRIQ